MTEHADIVIVGSGAAGAAFAWRVSGKALRVVCLEQGQWIDSAQSPSQQPDWELALQKAFHPNPNVRNAAADYAVDDSDSEIQPANYNAVGGSTIRWGAHFPRLHPSDFRTESLDGVGQDWPISYDDLAPYYDINDQMMGVSGINGDPANPHRTARQFPPLPLDAGTQQIASAFDALGWHWWPSDAAIISRSSGSRSGCNQCGPCGLGCPRRARASVDITYWPDAIAGGVELRTGCTVTALRANKTGTSVDAVEYIDATGKQKTIHASTVVVAASGLGTPRLLLNSIAADKQLASLNQSGALGRNLMLHPTAIVTGVFDKPVHSHRGPFACALYSQEFYESAPERGFTRGFQLQALRGQGPLGTAMGGYMTRLPWGREHHAQFLAEFDHSVSLTVTAEDLPEQSNYIDLHASQTDSRGLRIPRMHYHVGSNTKNMLAFGIERARDVLTAAGAKTTKVTTLSRPAGFHFLGTARMGKDADTSVVMHDGRCHTLPNLLVIDGSVFPSAGAVNPTPTLQAVALRSADALLDRLLPESTHRVPQHAA